MKNEIIRLECVDITVDGQGVCKKDGLVVFVKEMIPGEVADVKIIANKKTLAFGIIDKLVPRHLFLFQSLMPILRITVNGDTHDI